jgi:hypothetical protein
MLSEALSALDGKAELTAEDAITVRRIVFGGDVTVSHDEAVALMQLNADAGKISLEWRALFIEALTDYVVHQQPEGYVDDAKADWLVAAVRKEQHVREDEIEMLIHVLEQADQTPPWFSSFVLDLMKSLILARFSHQGRLAREDIERLRRVLFAAGGDGNVAVSRREAEVLFDINDAIGAAVSDPAWTDLFVRAISNAVLFETPWTPGAAHEREAEGWLDDASKHPFQRLAGLANPRADRANMLEGLREIVHWNFDDHQMDRALAADAALEANAERITADEAHWLNQRIGRNGRVDANEQALLAFLRANAREIDPALDEIGAGLAVQPAAPVQDVPPTDRPVFGRRKSLSV